MPPYMGEWSARAKVSGFALTVLNGFVNSAYLVIAKELAIYPLLLTFVRGGLQFTVSQIMVVGVWDAKTWSAIKDNWKWIAWR